MGCGASTESRAATIEQAAFAEALFAMREQLAQQRHRPLKIFLLRHGESMGAVDPTLLDDMPDTELPLSPEGAEQALEAGRRLRHELRSEGFELWTSPHRRCQETVEHLLTGTNLPECALPP